MRGVSGFFGLIFGLTLVIVDQAIKYFITSSDLQYTLNQGIAFGWLGQWAGSDLVIGLVLIILLSLVFLGKKADYWGGNGLTMLLSGGISNILDRFIYRGVVDYLWLGWGPRFNLADVYINIGVLILIGESLRKNNF